MKLVTGIYNSFLWGLLLATLLFNDTWLQMRVNIGYLFFASWLLLVIIWYLVTRHRSVKSGWLTIINTVLVSVVALVFEGTANLLVVPAALIREGLNLESVSFSAINLILVVIILIGLLLSIVRVVKHR